MTTTTTFDGARDGISIRTGKLDAACTYNCQIMGTAAYMLISPGYDRKGGVSESGAVNKNCTNSDKDNGRIDAQNCAYTGTTNTTMSTTISTSDVFYDSKVNRGFSESNYFDDIVVWHPKNRL